MRYETLCQASSQSEARAGSDREPGPTRGGCLQDPEVGGGGGTTAYIIKTRVAVPTALTTKHQHLGNK